MNEGRSRNANRSIRANSTSIGSGSFAPMDGNHPSTQYYLQNSDEAVPATGNRSNSTARLRGMEPVGATAENLNVSATDPERLISSHSKSEAKGDDQLNSSACTASARATPTGEQHAQEQQEGATPQQGGAAEQDRDRVDFVHVHLEHLPSASASGSQEEVHVLSDDAADNQAHPNRFSFYRKFASEGNSSPKPQPLDIPPSASSGSGGCHPASTKSIMPLLDSTISTFKRQQALQGTIQLTNVVNTNSAVEDEASLIAGHILEDEDFDFVTMNMSIAGSPTSATGGEADPLDLSQLPSHDIHPLTSNILSSNEEDTTNFHSPTSDDTRVIQPGMSSSCDYHPLDETNTNTATTGIGTATTDKSLSYLESHTMNDDNNYNTHDKDDNAHLQQQESESVHQDDCAALSHTGTGTTSVGTQPDELEAVHVPHHYDKNRANLLKKERQQDRKEKLLQRRDQKIRMTLAQTMQHNTRHSFCAIFLMGVALATLVLLVVTKWIEHTNKQESLHYDEEDGTSFVFNNNGTTELIMTGEVLAFALIMVLLVGSLCYLGAATCDSGSRPWVRAVKHEDACLANSSARRRTPNYQAPFVVQDSPNRSRHGNSRVTMNPNLPLNNVDDAILGCRTNRTEQTIRTEDALQSNSSHQQYQEFHQNQTFSMLSSGSVSTSNNDDEILISMEEADRYYQALEEEDPGLVSCCSPLDPLTEDHTDHFDDEDDV